MASRVMVALVAIAPRAQVAEHEVFEARGPYVPFGMMEGHISPNEPGCVAWAALQDRQPGGQGGTAGARPGDPVVGGQQAADIASHPDTRCHQDDEVVADALDIGDQMRRVQHG